MYHPALQSRSLAAARPSLDHCRPRLSLSLTPSVMIREESQVALSLIANHSPAVGDHHSFVQPVPTFTCRGGACRFAFGCFGRTRFAFGCFGRTGCRVSHPTWRRRRRPPC